MTHSVPTPPQSTGHTPAAPALPARRPRKFRRFVWVTLGLLVLLAGISAYLLYRTPTWYQPMHLTDPDVDLVAEAAQERLVEFGNRVQNAPMVEGVWTITQDQINALLAVRFAAARSTTYVAGHSGHDIANDITDPMVRFTPDVITLAARSPLLPGGPDKDSGTSGGRAGGAGGVGSLTITVKSLPPELVPGAIPGSRTRGNQLGIKVTGVWVNSLPLPNWVFQEQLDQTIPKLSAGIRQLLVSNIGPRADHYMPAINQWLDHVKQGEPFTPVMVTEGDRAFSLRDIRVEEGRITLIVGPP